jgi:cytochrome c
MVRLTPTSRAAGLGVILLLAQTPSAARADSAAEGKQAFTICAPCHSINGGKSLGPALNGLIWRKAGSANGFKLQPCHEKSGNHLGRDNPRQVSCKIPQKEIVGNRVPFAGLSDAARRIRIIEYLKSFD